MSNDIGAVSGTMKVTCEVEVEVGPWNGNASFNALQAQAEREAEQSLRNKLNGNARFVRVVNTKALVVERAK